MTGLTSRSLRYALVLHAAVLGLACHDHDDNLAATGGPGTSVGDFAFSPNPARIRAGELEDFLVSLLDGSPANITGWDLIQGPNGALVDRGQPDLVRFVAGVPGIYTLQASDGTGRTGSYTFEVVSSAAALFVSESVGGDDQDEVDARIDARSGDLFIADRVGDAAAPQRLARADRQGNREAEVTLPYKVDDLAVDAFGNLTTLQPATSLPDALRRYDRDLVEGSTFAAPSLDAGVTWADRVAMTRDGTTVLVTSHSGGSLLLLDQDGAPLNGDVSSSLLTSPIPLSEVIDLATDAEGSIYVASSTQIARVLSGGAIDTQDWSADPREAIVALAADDNGVVLVASRDVDGGQCGSLRKLDWLGGQTGVLTEFSTGTFFAPRKFVRPLDLAAYPDGSWRVYDDTYALSAIEVNAAWIVAADAPELPGGE